MKKAAALSAALGASIAESAADRVAPAGMPTAVAAPAADPRHAGVTRLRQAVSIPIDRIVRDPMQPREEFDPDALARLAESMKSHGQLQPGGVLWDAGQGAYVLLYGERRFRAAALAGRDTFDAIVHDRPLDPAERLVIQLVENACRSDLKPVERARAYRRLAAANGWSTRQVADAAFVSQSEVVKSLALLDLPEDLQAQVDAGAIPAAAGYELSRVADPAERSRLAAGAAAGALRVADVAAARKSDRPRPYRASFKVPGGTVAVALAEAEPSPEQVVAALQAAIKSARRPGALRSAG